MEKLTYTTADYVEVRELVHMALVGAASKKVSPDVLAARAVEIGIKTHKALADRCSDHANKTVATDGK